MQIKAAMNSRVSLDRLLDPLDRAIGRLAFPHLIDQVLGGVDQFLLLDRSSISRTRRS